MPGVPIRVRTLLVAAMLVAMASAAGAAPLLTVDASLRTRGGLTGVSNVRTLRLDATRLAALGTSSDPPATPRSAERGGGTIHSA